MILAGYQRMVGRYHRSAYGGHACDRDGDNTGPNYRPKFAEKDYVPARAEITPFGVPGWLGDDASGPAVAAEAAAIRVERDPEDLLHTLIWHAYRSQTLPEKRQNTQNTSRVAIEIATPEVFECPATS